MACSLLENILILCSTLHNAPHLYSASHSLCEWFDFSNRSVKILLLKPYTDRSIQSCIDSLYRSEQFAKL